LLLLIVFYHQRYNYFFFSMMIMDNQFFLYIETFQLYKKNILQNKKFIYYIYFLNSNKYLKNNHLFNLDIFSTSANILTIVFLTSYYIFINFKDSYLACSIEFYNSSITYIKNSWSSVDFIKLLLKKNISIFKINT